ncbi:hypothetical protein JQ607_10855 [Bradyrhizobium liaoningense]|uniref:hypothetical protein n=1 Tax=Bradyrhizobium liaoningense TaxID=43992 RepID=UPI001BADF8FD|nr:hypothetical protein [Bradyrhizobium liaoningense]MBR0840687.1 hypothetical protein [Bradyrhizobium liaoningense]
MTRWHPSLDLARLLEALSEEILTATDEEVRQTAGQQGWKIANSAHEIRELIRAARSDVDGNLDRNFDRSLSEDLSEPEAGPQPTRLPRSSSHNQPH